MELDTIMSYIATIGFPIVCCIYMWKFINGTLKEFRESLTEVKTIITEFKATVAENTRIMSVLCSHMESRNTDE